MYEKVESSVFLNEMFGLKEDTMAETVIATPIWNLEDFEKKADQVLERFQGWYKGITLKYCDRVITVVSTCIGAPLTGDCILALAHSKRVKNILFSGSAGSTNPLYEIGDYVVTWESVIGEGYSRYVNGFERDCFGEISCGDRNFGLQLIDELRSYTNRVGVKLYEGRMFSTDSILGEGPELFRFMAERKCDGIEMETSAVFTAAKKAGKKACGIILISDLPLRYKNLFEGISGDEERKFRMLRKEIPGVLLELAAKCI